jgi:hypothetical protein
MRIGSLVDSADVGGEIRLTFVSMLAHPATRTWPICG